MADWIIKPFTAKAACSFVEMVVDEGTVDQTPQWFISHWWGEPVRDFIEAVAAHTAVRGLDKTAAYWVCALAWTLHVLVDCFNLRVVRVDSPTRSREFASKKESTGSTLCA